MEWEKYTYDCKQNGVFFALKDKWLSEYLLHRKVIG